MHMHTLETTQLLTPPEAAAEIGRHRNTVLGWCRRRLLPADMVAGTFVIQRADFEAFKRARPELVRRTAA